LYEWTATRTLAAGSPTWEQRRELARSIAALVRTVSSHRRTPAAVAAVQRLVALADRTGLTDRALLGRRRAAWRQDAAQYLAARAPPSPQQTPRPAGTRDAEDDDAAGFGSSDEE
jgi:hypothetical protein